MVTCIYIYIYVIIYIYIYVYILDMEIVIVHEIDDEILIINDVLKPNTRLLYWTIWWEREEVHQSWPLLASPARGGRPRPLRTWISTNLPGLKHAKRSGWMCPSFLRNGCSEAIYNCPPPRFVMIFQHQGFNKEFQNPTAEVSSISNTIIETISFFTSSATFLNIPGEKPPIENASTWRELGIRHLHKSSPTRLGLEKKCFCKKEC